MEGTTAILNLIILKLNKAVKDEAVENIRMITERAYLRSPSIHVGMKAEITGAFSDEQFLDAVQKTCIRHPLLRSTIKINKTREAYYALNSSREIEVSFFQYTGPDQWILWYEDSDKRPFDFENGPLLRLVVFRNKESSIVVILGHHILGDGLAYLYLVRDLLGFLNGESNDTVLYPSVINEKTSLPRAAKPNWLSRFLIQRLNTAWKKNKKIFTNADYYTFFEEYRSKNHPGLYLNSSGKEETRAFVARCHDMHISMNEAILTAFLYAIQKCDKKHTGKPLEVGVAINVRKELVPPVGECMGNFVSGILVKAAYNYKKSFLENAKENREILKTKIENVHTKFAALNFLLALDPDLIDSICFAEYGNYDNSISKKVANILGERSSNKGIGVTNLGRIDIEYQNQKYVYHQ